MSAGPNESQEVVGSDRRRPIVSERMEIERVEREHSFIEHDADGGSRVVDECEGGYGSGRNTQRAFEQIGRGEGKARCAQHLRQSVQVDAELLAKDYEPEAALLVAQEQIFGVTAG